MNFERIPKDLKDNALFCCWRYEDDGERKNIKMPYNPLTGSKARSNDINTFATYGQAVTAYNLGGYSGIGVGIFGDLCAIDIDHCIDKDTGAFTDLADEIITSMDSYTELSPSGEGLHILFRAPGLTFDKEKWKIINRDYGLEMYIAGATSRYMTVTGDSIHEPCINNRTNEVINILNKYMLHDKVPQKGNERQVVRFRLDLDEQQIVEKASNAKNGDLFKRLMSGDTSMYKKEDGSDDYNKSDIALCNILAFYTDDAEKIDRIFRSSGLMREKWDRATAGSTYGRITIEKALSRVTEKYGSRIAGDVSKELVPSEKDKEIAQPKPKKSEKPQKAEKKKKAVEVYTPQPEDIGIPSGTVMLIPGKNGPEKSSRNVVRVLTQDPNLSGQIYYDEFRKRVRVNGQMPWPSEHGPRDWDDSDGSQFRTYLEDHIVGVAKGLSKDALLTAAKQRRIDPLVEFLDALKWDGKPRIATALHEYLGVEQTEWSARAMKHWLIGAVARGYEPGCKLDEMLLLYGSQGAGKSTFLSRFCPDPEWFIENLTRIDDKDALQILRGKWIVCFDELLAQKRADVVFLCKSFLTTRVDTYRKSYGEDDANYPRRCCFCGSTNELYFLTDRSGNRRYLPVTCDKSKAPKNDLIFDYSPEVTNEFMQMVAEAVSIYKSGTYTLAVTEADGFAAMQRAELAKYLEEDSREGVIWDYLENLAEDRVCIPMISVNALGGSRTPGKRETNELHAIMRTMPGWKVYDKNNGRARCGSFGLQTCYVRDVKALPEQTKREEVELL